MYIGDCLIDETFYFNLDPELYRLLTTGKGVMKMRTEKENIENRIEELKEQIESLQRRIENKRLLIEDYRTYLGEMDKLYYVKIIDHEEGYLNVYTDDGRRKTLDYINTSLLKTKFTEEEIKEMDPRYWQFAIPVENEAHAWQAGTFNEDDCE